MIGTILYIAVLAENPEVIKLLIANGAKINRQSPKGDTIFDIAKLRVNLEIINLLKEYGAVKWAQISTAAPDTL